MTIPNLKKDIKRCLTDWHKVAPETSPLSYLYSYRDIHKQHQLNTREATNRLLMQALEELKTSYEDEAKVLERRFLDSIPVKNLTNELNIADSTIYVLQRKGIAYLTEIVASNENKFAYQQKTRLLQRLDPPSYTNLVGSEQKIEQLIDLVSSPKAPWIISLEGIGGLGKTSLADALVRVVIEQGVFDEVGWVSARQTYLDVGGGLAETSHAEHTAFSIFQQIFAQLFPELASSVTNQSKMKNLLRERLKDSAHCIVIDNLESVYDVSSLMPILQDLSAPSKFVLTSRHSQYTAPNVYHFPLPQLNQAQTLALVRQEAEVSNVPLLITAPDNELATIYETVGGNPLAIRLVVGQSQIFSLRATLERLVDAKGSPAENLYTYIYRQAWDSLDEASQEALLAMPLIEPGGEPLESIADMTGLDEDILYTTLNQLVIRNLVDARGGLNERTYSIHSLTRSFLHQQIIKWT